MAAIGKRVRVHPVYTSRTYPGHVVAVGEGDPPVVDVRLDRGDTLGGVRYYEVAPVDVNMYLEDHCVPEVEGAGTVEGIRVAASPAKA